METHTSVYTTSAPATAFLGSTTTSTWEPAAFAIRSASFKIAEFGRFVAGHPTEMWAPTIAAPRRRELHTLFPSPTYAILSPFSFFFASRIVNRSEMI